MALLRPPLQVQAERSLPAAAEASPITFSADLRSALAGAREHRMPIVLVFGAAWCPNCQRMQAETFSSPEVRAVRERFLWVLVDIDRNLTLARDHDVHAVPQIHLLDYEGRPWARLIGVVGPTRFRAYLEEALVQQTEVPDRVPPAPILKTNDFRQTALIYTPDGYRGLSICGPLKLKSQSPFQALRLGLVPRTPSTLARGQAEARAAMTWSNVWADGGRRYALDFEGLDASTSLAHGIADVLQVEAEFEDRSRFGGELDGLIQGFHELFGIDQNGRDKVPKGAFRFDLKPGGGMPPVSLGERGSGSFSRSLILTLQHNVSCGRSVWPAFSYAVTGRLPLMDARDLDGGGSLDVGLSTSVSRRFGRLYAYQTLELSRFARNSFRGIPLRRDQVSSLTALEWRFRPSASLLLQYQISEGVAEDFGSFSRPSREIVVGVKGEVVRGTVLEIGLIENVVTHDNSPDFGLHVGVTRRLSGGAAHLPLPAPAGREGFPPSLRDPKSPVRSRAPAGNSPSRPGV